MSLLSLLSALAIGGALGLVGGGGSILTVPALVYVAGLSPQAAVAGSLIVVGVTAALASWLHARRGLVDGKVALHFGGLGALGAWLGGRLAQQVEPRVLMAAFGVVALGAGLAMLLGARSGARLGTSAAGSAPPGRRIVVGAALGVGFLTGLLGVGGGFLIVPALVFAVGLPMARAVGTSLLVIGMNCLAGLVASHTALERDIWPVVAGFTLVSAAGSALGMRAGQRLAPRSLRRAFALVILCVGAAVLIRG